MKIKIPFMLVVLAALLGCGRGGPSEPAIMLAARYSAVSVGGASLPAVVQESPYREELLGGTLLFTAEGRCTLALDVRTTEIEGTRRWTYGGTCTYSSRAGSVRLEVDRIGPFELRVSGERLVLLPGPGGGSEILFAPTAG